MAHQGITPRSSWSDVEAMLGADALEALERPLSDASSLPNACYTDEAWQKLEFERLFARNWFVAGFVQDIPDPGDALPVTTAGMPLLILRDHDGDVRVFHNVCRHRGAVLVDKPCSGLKLLTCPYHAWAYGLDGNLRTRPHFHGGGHHDVTGKDGDGPGLVPVRTEVWHHWIFINIDGKAPPLADYLAPALEKITGYDLTASRYAGTVHFDIATNWKFAMENYIEPYHVFAAHPRLHAFVPMAEREPSKIDRHVMWNRYLFKQAQAGRGEGLPHFPDLSDQTAHQGLWFILPVPFGFEVYPDHVASFHVTPIAPGRCHERIDIYLIGEAATSPDWAQQREAVLDMWHDLNSEDVGLIESLQKGRTSPAYDGGRLSPYWDEAPLHLSRMIIEGMR
ncbi:MAG: aromatic ring-hydroxylating dioxygenase subunit alpha [Rhodospirillaceae bacterium]|jgi:choline monooxygenase|nr:aromatic ring-hydroxylating dioxygenase subunit alpha [Rhodospirillaceae bacterium]MBT6202346.1 aromatic ring-hydroxylating dioxygenase subunit alpha [Rhodospirillaceae bacterium]